MFTCLGVSSSNATNIYVKFLSLPTLVFASRLLRQAAGIYDIFKKKDLYSVEKYEGHVSFKGGIQKVLDARRARKKKRKTPTVGSDSPLSSSNESLDAELSRKMKMVELERLEILSLENQAGIRELKGGAAAGTAAASAAPLAPVAAAAGDSAAAGTAPFASAGTAPFTGSSGAKRGKGSRGLIKKTREVRAFNTF